MPIYIRLTMLCLSSFELYSRWVPLTYILMINKRRNYCKFYFLFHRKVNTLHYIFTVRVSIPRRNLNFLYFNYWHHLSYNGVDVRGNKAVVIKLSGLKS